MSRLKFFLYTILNWFVFICSIIIFDNTLSELIIGSLIICLFCQLYLAAARLTDVGLSKWWMISFIIPIINIYTNFIISFAPTGYEIKDHENFQNRDKWYWLGLICTIILVPINLLLSLN